MFGVREGLEVKDTDLASSHVLQLAEELDALALLELHRLEVGRSLLVVFVVVVQCTRLGRRKLHAVLALSRRHQLHVLVLETATSSRVLP